MNFNEAFRKTQEALGLHHFTARFFGEPGPGLLATTESDAANCTALVRVDEERCEKADEVVTTAVHECLHMMLADLKHAYQSVPDAVDWQEEQLVRRLEPVVLRGVFHRKARAFALADAQRRYIKLLEAELDETVPLAGASGWKSSRHEYGCRIRAEIEAAKLGE